MSNGFLHIQKYYDLAILMRVKQPIGIFLLLWPTLWGLWLSSEGIPNFTILVIFICGVLCMRSAGCIINDYIDCDIDSLVERTKNRPLSAGFVTKKDALAIFLILLVIAVILVLNLNVITIFLSFIALLLSGIYPYLKRYIYYPQIVLGVLFSWPILMAFTATHHVIDSSFWLLFIINMIWTIMYDTQYALMDREDDKCIGVKSFAILIEGNDEFVIGSLQFFIIFLLWIFGWIVQLSAVFYFFSIYGVFIVFIWQQVLIHKKKKLKYFRAFLSNNYVGMLVFIGIVFGLS